MNKTTKRLLSILADGKFHSGSDIGEQFGLTRSAIWKCIKQLEQHDIGVTSITGKGYRLEQAIQPLNETAIRSELSSDHQKELKKLIIHDSTGSTNDDMLTLARTYKQAAAVFAEQQSFGRGRQGKSWTSSYGKSILMSLLWPTEQSPDKMMGLSIVAAIAVARALKRYGIEQDIGIKWPNDIYFDHKKLGGILVELRTESHSNCQAVIGIGLNCQELSKNTAKAIDQAWTSLQSLSDTAIQRNRLAGILLDECFSALELFKRKGLSAFIDEWNQLDVCRDKAVTLIKGQREIHGIMRGISEHGEIFLEESGVLKAYFNGEVSLRLK